MKVQVEQDKLQDWIDNNTKTGDCITTTELDSWLIEVEFNLK